MVSQWVSVGLCRILGKSLTIFHYIKKILNYLLKDKARALSFCFSFESRPGFNSRFHENIFGSKD